MRFLRFPAFFTHLIWAGDFISREGEAPAEPLRGQLGRSLAVP